MKVAISSGHGTKVRGASGYIDEVDEAILVMDQVAAALRRRGVHVATFTDKTSTSQSANLDRIVDWHNDEAFDGGAHDFDVSVHFNAFEPTEKPMGTEVLYLTQEELAEELAGAIASAGHLINRGGKYRNDLAVLNGCAEPTVLLEICFVDSAADVECYGKYFEDICDAIADVIVSRAEVA